MRTDDGHPNHRPTSGPTPAHDPDARRSHPAGPPGRPALGRETRAAGPGVLRARAEHVLGLVLDLERDLLFRPSISAEQIDAIGTAVCDLDHEIAGTARESCRPSEAADLRSARRSLSDANLLTDRLLLRMLAA